MSVDATYAEIQFPCCKINIRTKLNENYQQCQEQLHLFVAQRTNVNACTLHKEIKDILNEPSSSILLQEKLASTSWKTGRMVFKKIVPNETSSFEEEKWIDDQQSYSQLLEEKKLIFLSCEKRFFSVREIQEEIEKKKEEHQKKIKLLQEEWKNWKHSCTISSW